jgi:hypothetical protein
VSQRVEPGDRGVSRSGGTSRIASVSLVFRWDVFFSFAEESHASGVGTCDWGSALGFWPTVLGSFGVASWSALKTIHAANRGIYRLLLAMWTVFCSLED